MRRRTRRRRCRRWCSPSSATTHGTTRPTDRRSAGHVGPQQERVGQLGDEHERPGARPPRTATGTRGSSRSSGMHPSVRPTWGNSDSTPAVNPTRGRRGQVEQRSPPPPPPSPTTSASSDAEEHRRRGRGAPPGRRRGRCAARRSQVRVLLEGGVRHARAEGHEEDREDGAHEVGGRGAGGGHEHVLAAGHPLVERVDARRRRASLSSKSRASSPTRSSRSSMASAAFGRLGLEPVEGLLDLVEHEVGGAHADGADGEEGEQHRRDPPDVHGEAIDDRVEQHRGGHRGGRPGDRPVGGDEHLLEHDQPDDGADDRERRRRGEAVRPPLHGPRRAGHPAVPYRR